MSVNSTKPNALHTYLQITRNVQFSTCEKSSSFVIHPLCISRMVEHIVFGLATTKQSSFVIPHWRAAIPKDTLQRGSLMKTKALFENSHPLWKELRPCASQCVKEAGRWRRDDTGLIAEEHRVVLSRMNSDWRSAQWQLNDLRSVDSVSINQTALSCSPTFFPSPLLAKMSPFMPKPWAGRGRFVPTLCFFCFPFLYYLSVSVTQSLYHLPFVSFKYFS